MMGTYANRHILAEKLRFAASAAHLSSLLRKQIQASVFFRGYVHRRTFCTPPLRCSFLDQTAPFCVSPLNKDQGGVTLVELMVSISIAAMISIILFGFTLTFFGSTVRSQVTAEMAVDTQFMLRAIIEDVRLGDGIGATNTLPDANAPGGVWTTSDTNNVLIIKQPATTDSKDIIYDDSTGSPYDNEYVYFVTNNTLYKRLIKNGAATGNTVVTSCPAAAVSPSCPLDRKYSSYVTNLSFTFYDNDNIATTDPTLASTASVSLTLSRKVYGKTLTFNNSILTKLRN